jgi:hypothetical protein
MFTLVISIIILIDQHISSRFVPNGWMQQQRKATPTVGISFSVAKSLHEPKIDSCSIFVYLLLQCLYTEMVNRATPLLLYFCKNKEK